MHTRIDRATVQQIVANGAQLVDVRAATLDRTHPVITSCWDFQ